MNMDEKKYTIDAAGRTMGRVATEAAKMLMGKTRADYTPHVLSHTKVAIMNASKLHVDERKEESQVYQTYSGYPGGQRTESMRRLTARKGRGAALRVAITRMLPRNTMRISRLKNLTISE